MGARLSLLALAIQALAGSDPGEAEWREMAARCASDLPWATSWADAAQRAGAEGKLVLVLYENYEALGLPSTARSGPFTDPDFGALVRERFVPVELGPRDEAALRDPEVYGLSEHAWGTGYLFARPDGRVVAESSVSNASYLDGFARAVLARIEDSAGADAPPPAAERLERAQASFRRGDLDAARKNLGDENSAEGHRLRAAIARRERQGDAALEALSDAKRVASEDLEPEIACDRAVILMRMERTEEAWAELERVLAQWPGHARAQEAAFWLGAFEVLSNGLESGSVRWKKLADEHPESPWAWKAAANLIEEGSLIHGAERLDWPEPDLVECTTVPELRPLDAENVAQAEHDAVAWLVAHQREDGSWWCPGDGFGLGAQLFTPAISALCATSLLVHLDAKGARAAVEKTLRYELELFKSGQLEAGEDLAGVYSIWNRTFVAWFLAKAMDARAGTSRELSRPLQALVDSVLESQDRRGGWPYIHLPDPSGGEGPDPSASFLTAGVVIVLVDAREAGARVPRGAIEKAVEFLERLRDEDGTYQYMHEVPGALVGGIHPEACGRGPVCELALKRGGRGDTQRVKKALRSFLRQRSGFRKEWHKELCHTSPEGFGSHYVFYDYAFAAAATRELPRAERARYGQALLEDVLAARREDGSFQDMPGLGRPYGTAMALIAMKALREK